jgi:hypothetical protein
MAWRIEYTDHPWVKKKRKKILESVLRDVIEDVVVLLEIREDMCYHIEDLGFLITSVWLSDVGKHHLGVRDSEKDDRWVASLVFDDYPTLTVDEVRSILRGMGLHEYSIGLLGTTNETTVGEHLVELEEEMDAGKTDREKRIASSLAKLLEMYLNEGAIALNDGLLDAMRKIEKAT